MPHPFEFPTHCRLLASASFNLDSCENSKKEPLCIVVDGNMVPRTLLQTRCYAPAAAGSVLTSFEGLLHPVKACIGQMRGLVTPGEARRQSRSLDTLATTDDSQVASMVATRAGHAYAEYANDADYAHMRNMRMRMRIENLIHIIHI